VKTEFTKFTEFGSGNSVNFFADPTRRAHFEHELRSWIGTPFHGHACIRGAGVDCIHLLGEVYVATGFLESYSFPKYALDGGAHAPASLVIEWLHKSGCFVQVEAPEPGDLLCFAFKRLAWHVGGCIGGHQNSFIHAIAGAGVCEDHLPWSKRLTRIYRPMKGAQ
jgi:cell wall-associated NlpC family hydrolase